jgi:sulfur carrier protein
MIVRVNGVDTELPDGCTVAELLARLAIPVAGTAVACNDTVVRRAMHGETALTEGDRVEIIRAVAGG